MWINIEKKTGSIKHNNSYEGERIEEKVERFVHGGEPITDTAPLIYTERDEGVLPEYNIRTDRFDVAIEAMDYVTKSARAKTINMFDDGKKGEEKGDASSESTQATDGTSDGTDK